MGQGDNYNNALQLICKAQLKSMRAQCIDILTIFFLFDRYTNINQCRDILNKDPIMLKNQLQSGPTTYKVVNKTNHIDPMHIKLTNQMQCTLTNQIQCTLTNQPGFRQTTNKAKKDTNRDHVQNKLLPITMNDYKTHGLKPQNPDKP
jgi:hypothetical protein